MHWRCTMPRCFGTVRRASGTADRILTAGPRSLYPPTGGWTREGRRSRQLPRTAQRAHRGDMPSGTCNANFSERARRLLGVPYGRAVFGLPVLGGGAHRPGRTRPQAVVQIVPPSFLQAAACNGRPHCKVMGWFPPGEAIYLDERLDFEHDLLANSVVVHEMVHYLQHQSGKYRAPYSCEDFLAMEREAYQAQRDFLLRYGTYYPVGVSMHHAGCQLTAGRASWLLNDAYP